jgi:hypothetical protein
MITLSIETGRIDKRRLKEVTKKDGTKAHYLELVLFETASEYGDYIVKQQCTKEERAQGVQLPILGNGKIWAKPGSKPAPGPAAGDDPDGVPF